jgi:hypothetical protein
MLKTVLPRGQKTVAAVRSDSQYALIRIYVLSLRTRRWGPDELWRPKAKTDCLRPSRLAVLANLSRLLLWLSCDRNLNVGTLFELHIIAMFVS